jgi:hypothetical protein
MSSRRAAKARGSLPGAAYRLAVSEIDPTSADWIDGYRTAEAEYEAGHGSKDDQLEQYEELVEAIWVLLLNDNPCRYEDACEVCAPLYERVRQAVAEADARSRGPETGEAGQEGRMKESSAIETEQLRKELEREINVREGVEQALEIAHRRVEAAEGERDELRDSLKAARELHESDFQDLGSRIDELRRERDEARAQRDRAVNVAKAISREQHKGEEEIVRRWLNNDDPRICHIERAEEAEKAEAEAERRAERYERAIQTALEILGTGKCSVPDCEGCRVEREMARDELAGALSDTGAKKNG